MDELSLGLMPKMVDLCLDALMQLKREGLTIVLVEQNTARALDVADQVCVLVVGRAGLLWNGVGGQSGRLDVRGLPRHDRTRSEAGSNRKPTAAGGRGRNTMTRMLSADDLEAGLIGGLFLSAGGSGRNAVEKNRRLGGNGA